MEKYQVGRNYPLFEHMDQEHGLTLLEDQLWQIERIVLKMHGIDPDKCTMNPQSNPHVSRTIPEQIEYQMKQKGNQLDQVYGAMKEETAMQQLIEELEKSRSDIKEVYRPLSHLMYVNNVRDMLIEQINAHIRLAEYMLEIEKEQLDKALQEGAETAQNDAAKEIRKNYTANKL